jgi:hypothetical protein
MDKGETERAWRDARRRSVEAKKHMDKLRIEFEAAEDEHHQACRAPDQLENGMIPRS